MRVRTPQEHDDDAEVTEPGKDSEITEPGKEQPSQSRSRSVGLWRIEQKLGTGSTAYVYSATNIVDGRRAALKILRNEAVDDATRQRFKREGHVANAVGHPGVVRIFDQGVTDRGSLYIVMEMLDGQSLESLRLAQGGTLPVPQVVELGCQLLDVLAAAHARRIIHRDLKPANVFLTADGQLKVLDFGLARIWDAERSSSISRTGIIMGTPAFMPPEQARGRRSMVDAQSDVWAVGATLFTLITGRAVHVASSHPAQLLAVLTKPAPALRTVAPHVPAEIAAVIDKALAFEREQRWDDAGAMLDALQRARSPVRTNTLGRPRSSAPPPPLGAQGSSVEVPPLSSRGAAPPPASTPKPLSKIASATTPIPTAAAPMSPSMKVATPPSSARGLAPSTPGEMAPVQSAKIAPAPPSAPTTSTWAQTAVSGILAGLVAGGMALGAVVYSERHRHRAPPTAAQATPAAAASASAPPLASSQPAGPATSGATAAVTPAAATESAAVEPSIASAAAAVAAATPTATVAVAVPAPEPSTLVAAAIPAPVAAPAPAPPKPKPAPKKPDPPPPAADTTTEPAPTPAPAGSASSDEPKPAPPKEPKAEPKHVHDNRPSPDPSAEEPREE